MLFTDVVDSCGLHVRLGDEAMDHLRRRHYEQLAKAIAAAGGREVKRLGDGVMAAFASAVDAVRCAVRIQRAVAADADGTAALEVRVALNSGEVTHEQDDYFGAAVNVAARLCQAADGGQILVSDIARCLVGNRGGEQFDRLPALTLKGIPEPVSVWTVRWESDGPIVPPAARRLPPMSAPFPAALAQPSPTSFVGRADDLGRLVETWQAAAAGEVALAFVAGEPGIGKTRLCAEFARRVFGEGGLVMFGHADEEALVPYQPFVESIGELLGALDDGWRQELLRAAGDELLRMTPRHRTTAPRADPSAGLDAETERFRIFESVATALGRAAESAPLLLVLDDLHWADKPSLLLLRHIARSPKVSRLLILATYRETDLDRRHPLSDALADLRREQGYERVLLRGFSSSEVQRFIEAGAGHEVSGRGVMLAEAIHRETEGNPFFVAEVVRHYVETGAFFKRDGVWDYAGSSVADLGLPEGVRDVIGRRLDRLRPETNQVLALASVLGREFEFDVLAAMAGDQVDVLAAVEDATERALLVEAPRARAVAYAFSHALVRQTLYEELSLPRKQKLHLRAAEAIERVHRRNLDGYVPALAVHLESAGLAADPEKTIGYAIRAGRMAYAAAAYEEAVTYLEAANRLIEEDFPESPAAGQVLEQLGDLMYMTGIDRARGIEYLHRALALYRQTEDPRIVLVHSRLGRAYSTFPEIMNIPLAFEHYNAALDIVRESPDSVSLGYLYTGIASAGLFGDKPEVGLAAAQRALAIAETTGEDGLRANALSLNGWFLAATGRCADGWQMLDESWQLADRIGHVMGAYFATWQLAALGFFAWDVRRGQAAAQREIDSGRLSQIPEWGNFLVCTNVDQQLALGVDGPAREFLAAHPDQDLYPNVLMWRLMLLDGRWEEAARWTEKVTRQWAVAGVDVMVEGYQTGRAMSLELLGDLAGAVAAIDEPMTSNPGSSVVTTGFFHWFRARLYLALNDADAAQRVVDRIRAKVTVAEWGGLGGRLDEIQAEILLVRGDLSGAQRLYASAVVSSDAFPYVMLDAEFQFRWASALQRAGEHELAAPHFGTAIAIYQRYGFAQRWVDRVDADRAQA